jgi:hypothetical protein
MYSSGAASTDDPRTRGELGHEDDHDTSPVTTAPVALTACAAQPAAHLGRRARDLARTSGAPSRPGSA